jgi:hypothetical protein
MAVRNTALTSRRRRYFLSQNTGSTCITRLWMMPKLPKPHASAANSASSRFGVAPISSGKESLVIGALSRSTQNCLPPSVTKCTART